MAENQIICAFIFEKNAYPIKLLKGISISLCGNLQEHIIDVMKRTILFCLLTVCTLAGFAQGSVRGKVLDKSMDESMPFVNVVVFKQGDTKPFRSAISDEKGLFHIMNLPYGQYTLQLSFIGYKELKRNFAVSEDKKHVSYKQLYMSDDTQTLEGVTVTAQRSPVKLEVDRKSFDVSQDISNAGGSASDVLENIPSVEVDNDGNVSLRGNSSVEVWINGKASGLTSDNRAEILQQLPAESIDRIEVIDNPSAKFSAEGSAGIINIVLKRDRKAGYYGSLQAGGNSRGGANASGNINFNTGRWEGFLNIGYRHRSADGGSESEQNYLNTNSYQWYKTKNERMGNNLFTRAGLTFHATDKDELSIGGNLMIGRGKNHSNTPYHYGQLGADADSYLMMRHTASEHDMRMMHGELGYRHNFTDKHFLNFSIDYNNWRMDNDNIYQDSTEYFNEDRAVEYNYQFMPMYMRSHFTEIKLDYENPISEQLTLQAGYQANINRENSPQESFADNTSWDGNNRTEDEEYYNRFIYDIDIHALYATASMKFGQLGIMAGLRGEYWKVNTESYDYWQEKDASLRNQPYKKDFFELFPSLFLSYQMTESQQLQVNYTRRLRRPHGHELNSFRNTRDASIISYGNPELTPEFSNSFSLNYLKTWTQHSLLLSAYYRPTTDVMQRINYQSSSDGLMYSTTVNVAKSVSTGLELVMKNTICRLLNLTTTANAYYYKLNGFSYDIDGQTVTGAADDNFTWNARMQAGLMLPYDISLQVTGNYNARQVISQGYRKANYSVDLGVRKNFLNKALTLALNCRDVFNSRCFETYTSSETFTRHQKGWHNGRRVNLTLTWSFGNTKAKKPKRQVDEEGESMGSGYEE